MTTVARRIVLRLEPNRSTDGGLAAAAHFAAALHMELAARLISDTRVMSALAVTAYATPQAKHRTPGSFDALVKRSETTLRHAVSKRAGQERASWSFEVVHCAGLLTTNDQVVLCDDIVAFDLPRAESAPSDLREEVTCALQCARGVLLLPPASARSAGPVVTITPAKGDTEEVSERIAASLQTKFATMARDAVDTVATFAATVRQRRASLAVLNADDPLAKALIARPRYLRELGAPLLLLKSA